ncbi:MAG: inositol monophosphatase [Pseudomonadota bacterium]|nr:inositol monophosphatase [Pseudomonadota bacterium]
MNVDIDAVTTIIREVAAAFILPRFRNLQPGDTSFKIGDDPVTIADQEAELALSERLMGLLEGSKVVGEEAFSTNRGVLERISGPSPVWIIDPIDGTRNFVEGNTEFGVIVALAKQNQTIAGWLYDPTSAEVITAEKGAGAWYQGRKLKVAAPTTLSEASGFLCGELYGAGQKAFGDNNIGPRFKPIRAGIHEYPRLLAGGPYFGATAPPIHFRASLRQSNPWDDAAGVLIHQEAGGYSAFWDGTPYRPSVMDKGLAVATDQARWDELAGWLARLTALS